MPTTEIKFAELMDRVRLGSNGAVQELLSHYGEPIYRAVRRRLHRKMRTQFDSHDFVQAVWASFFAKQDLFDRFDRPEQLLAFLQTVAGNKVIDECRRQLLLSKRNVNRVQETANSSIEDELSAVARDPSPSQVAVAREQADRMTEGQPSYFQRIVDLRLNGATFEEIADHTGISERTIRRIVKRIRRRIEG